MIEDKPNKAWEDGGGSDDIRSSRYVFLSHCILAQGIMAQGIVRRFPAQIKPVVQFCLDNNINMIQMPCPESKCTAGGLVRTPHGKKWYEEHGLRETCKRIAVEQVKYMLHLSQNGQVLAIIGMEFSPACAVNLLNIGRRIVRDKGIYVEELQAELKRVGLGVPFIGVNQRGLKKLAKELGHLTQMKLGPTDAEN